MFGFLIALLWYTEKPTRSKSPLSIGLSQRCCTCKHKPYCRQRRSTSHVTWGRLLYDSHCSPWVILQSLSLNVFAGIVPVYYSIKLYSEAQAPCPQLGAKHISERTTVLMIDRVWVITSERVFDCGLSSTPSIAAWPD